MDAKLTQIGRSDAKKLIKLKKCLKGEPRSYIFDILDIDENYSVALKILDEFYYDTAVNFGNVISKLTETPKMSGDALPKGLFLALTKAKQTLQGLKVTPEQSHLNREVN